MFIKLGKKTKQKSTRKHLILSYSLNVNNKINDNYNLGIKKY